MKKVLDLYTILDSNFIRLRSNEDVVQKNEMPLILKKIDIYKTFSIFSTLTYKVIDSYLLFPY